MEIGLLLLTAYLLGSISFAVVASWLFELPDPRTYGSKNPGATNVLRSGKKIAAVLTLLGDAGKGWLAVILAKYFSQAWELGSEAVAGVALAVFLGHLFPIFLGFKGGKGVATSAGVLLGLDPLLGLLVIFTWILVAMVWRISSLSALVAALLAPIYAYILLGLEINVWAITTISLLLLWRHKPNIINLATGREARIGEKSK
ncbi:glycerol-3-phosphate 1-O-acyltransferase PlsY [Nitrosomonas sp. Is37]|uniref:glycerol-3-phosphate 1-O-acyltransferase PlsY n=1 Tax=Nitrosomonas sp. Is37 TaxID=3080535 RepID=UPI00294B1180|nr:glycerol-3-phosphate 1-O-acyltransferase PlsY [Nitrosomonas sp. Is37]MDV6344817.1 glycerol-3-phosphate 1-O-acyltransferase PlsY [Nitrosomonas sp. Is37]